MQDAAPLRVLLPRPPHLTRVLKTLIDFDPEVVLYVTPSGLRIQSYNSSQPTGLIFVSIGVDFFGDYNFFGTPRYFQIGLKVESLLKVIDLCGKDVTAITFYPDYLIFSSWLKINPVIQYEVAACDLDVECFKTSVYGDSEYIASLIIPKEDFYRILNCGQMLLISGTQIGLDGNDFLTFSSTDAGITSTFVFGRGDVINVNVNEPFSFEVDFGPFFRSLSEAQKLSPTVEFTFTRTCLLLQFYILDEDAYVEFYFTQPQDNIRLVFKAIKSLY